MAGASPGIFFTVSGWGLRNPAECLILLWFWNLGRGGTISIESTQSHGLESSKILLSLTNVLWIQRSIASAMSQYFVWPEWNNVERSRQTSSVSIRGPKLFFRGECVLRFGLMCRSDNWKASMKPSLKPLKNQVRNTLWYCIKMHLSSNVLFQNV